MWKIIFIWAASSNLIKTSAKRVKHAARRLPYIVFISVIERDGWYMIIYKNTFLTGFYLKSNTCIMNKIY